MANLNNVVTKREDIQGLRAIAALAVVLFHASNLLPGGFLGVDIFFVISGFIIFYIASKEVAATGGFRFRRFLARRMLRIFPPMICVVLVTIVVGTFIDSPLGGAASLPMTGLAALTGTVNYYFLHSATDYFQSFRTNPLLHLWSLSVELQFYVLFAVLAKGCVALGLENRISWRFSTGVAVLVTGGFFLASFSIESWADFVGIAQPRVFSFFMLFTHLWEFGLGALAFAFHTSFQIRQVPSVVMSLVQLCAAGAIVFGLLLGTDTALVPGYQAILPVVGTALLIALGPNGGVSRLLRWPVFQFFGDRSYSIYIWQGPLIVFGAMLFAPPVGSATGAVASVLVALALFRPIELSFQHLNASGNWSGKQYLVLVGSYTFVLALLVAAQMLLVPFVQNLQAPAPIRATALDQNCERQRGVSGLEPCIYGDSSELRLMLIGDSHAGAISQAVVDAADSLGWQAVVATASACTVPEYPENVAYRSSCKGYAQRVAEYARDHGIQLVIIQQFSDFYVARLGIGVDRWRSGLEGFVNTLAAAGIKVLIVGDNLSLPISVGRPIWAENWTIDLSAEIYDRRLIEAVESEIASVNENVDFLSSRQFLCNGSRCPVFAKGNWLYTDTDHLSYLGAEPLVAPITDAITRLQAH